ncbi:MAG: acyltransferase [Clostridiaceae bacterium]
MKNEFRLTQYAAIDCVKFLCAVLIINSHYISENAVGRISKYIDYASSLYIIVVPFFFVCSGFFLFHKIYMNTDNKGVIVKKYLIRILKLYLAWSAIYVTFKLLKFFRFGTTTTEVLSYVKTVIVYSTYNTIWFLPALCIGVIIVYFLNNHFDIYKIVGIGIIIYTIGALGASYNFLLNEAPALKSAYGMYILIFETTRNGLFNGFPFVAIGALIAKETIVNTNHNSTLRNIVLMIVFGFGFVLEAFIIKIHFSAENANTILLLLPFTYFFVKACLDIKLQSSKLLVWMRKMSMTMFLCQRLFLSALPELLPNSFFNTILKGNPYIGLLYILTITMICSEIIITFSGKNKIIKMLC